MDVNLTGAFFMSQAVVKHMKTREWKDHKHCFIGGKGRFFAAGCHYGTTKAGMIGMTKCFASLAQYNITVYGLLGPVAT